MTSRNFGPSLTALPFPPSHCLAFYYWRHKRLFPLPLRPWRHLWTTPERNDRTSDTLFLIIIFHFLFINWWRWLQRTRNSNEKWWNKKKFKFFFFFSTLDPFLSSLCSSFPVNPLQTSFPWMQQCRIPWVCDIIAKKRHLFCQKYLKMIIMFYHFYHWNLCIFIIWHLWIKIGKKIYFRQL